jgi:hypothetical protein
VLAVILPALTLLPLIPAASSNLLKIVHDRFMQIHNLADARPLLCGGFLIVINDFVPTANRLTVEAMPSSSSEMLLPPSGNSGSVFAMSNVARYPQATSIEKKHEA